MLRYCLSLKMNLSSFWAISGVLGQMELQFSCRASASLVKIIKNCWDRSLRLRRAEQTLLRLGRVSIESFSSSRLMHDDAWRFELTSCAKRAPTGFTLSMHSADIRSEKFDSTHARCSAAMALDDRILAYRATAGSYQVSNDKLSGLEDANDDSKGHQCQRWQEKLYAHVRGISWRRHSLSAEQAESLIRFVVPTTTTSQSELSVNAF